MTTNNNEVKNKTSMMDIVNICLTVSLACVSLIKLMLSYHWIYGISIVFWSYLLWREIKRELAK